MDYTKTKGKGKRLFCLPPKGILESNGPSDPLSYYYKFIVGRIFCARIEHALSLLSPPYKSILELGYGSGVLLPSLFSIGENVSGVDLNSDPAKVQTNLDKIEVKPLLIKGDISEQYFQGNSFDLVITISTLEHISDISPVIDRVYDLLLPGGEFLIGMPRVDALMDIGFRLIGCHKTNEYHVLTTDSV